MNHIDVLCLVAPLPKSFEPFASIQIQIWGFEYIHYRFNSIIPLNMIPLVKVNLMILPIYHNHLYIFIMFQDHIFPFFAGLILLLWNGVFMLCYFILLACTESYAFCWEKENDLQLPKRQVTLHHKSPNVLLMHLVFL